MHDPKAVTFEIPRPWPRRSRSFDPKPGRPRWQMRLRHECGDYCEQRPEHEKRDPFPWWRLRSYSRFWTVAGRSYYWPALITIWHEEPDGKDSGTVCPHYRRWQDEGGQWQFESLRSWRWHVHHWRIQVHPWQTLRRWLFERCELCGHRFPYGYAPVSHQWHSPKPRRLRVERRSFHHECSELVHARQTIGYDEQIIRALVTEIRVRADEAERETVERLTGHKTPMSFHLAYRLQRLLGYERDDEYRLIKKDLAARHGGEA